MIATFANPVLCGVNPVSYNYKHFWRSWQLMLSAIQAHTAISMAAQLAIGVPATYGDIVYPRSIRDKAKSVRPCNLPGGNMATRLCTRDSSQPCRRQDVLAHDLWFERLRTSSHHFGRGRSVMLFAPM